MPEQLSADFTDLLLRYLVTDRHMLAAIGGMADPKDFEDPAEQLICQFALKHWRDHQEPIGTFLRIEVGDYIDNRRKPLKDAQKQALNKLVKSILKGERQLTAAVRVQKMFQQFKQEQYMRRSMDEVLELEMTGKLSVETFAKIASKCANYTMTTEFASRDYTETLDERIDRRSKFGDDRYPLFFIDPLDERIRAPGRKELGLFMAPWKSGKGQALVFTALSLAKQHYNTIHIANEDVQDVVDSRFDAQIADLPISQVAQLSNDLYDRFSRAVKRWRGRLKMVDAVGKNLSIQQIDGIWEYERSQGFKADAIVLDYDEKVAPPRQLKDKRFEIDETYKEILDLAGSRNLVFWTAAQVGRKGEKRKIIDGSQVAEDIGKVRKATCAIGIGWGDNGDKNKYLYIAGHRDGSDRFGVDIMTNYANGMFYDREATLKQFGRQKKSKVEVD